MAEQIRDPYAPKPGELYYNYDLKTIEFHDGYGWRQVDNTTRSGRAVWMGGNETNASGGQDDTTTTSDTVIISTLEMQLTSVCLISPRLKIVLMGQVLKYSVMDMVKHQPK